jgi:hypothetical protein
MERLGKMAGVQRGGEAVAKERETAEQAENRV